MIINGVERRFFMGVGAAMKIAEICPARDIARFSEFFGTSITADMLNVISVAACAMNENQLAVAGIKAEPLKRSEVLTLTIGEWAELANEVAEAYKNGIETTIKAEPKKGKNGESAAEA